MRLLRDELEERGLEVLDTSDALARVGQENAWDDVYVSYVHFGANGHAAVAQDIFPEILEYLR
jgi:hypothetical protein